MKVPSRRALLAELDRLGHGARTARVAKLGRDARGSPELAALMAALEQGDTYEALLALELARGARDGAHIVRALAHPSLLVRHRAAAFTGAFALDDAALEAALPSLAPETRRRVFASLIRARREALAARLLPRVLARYGAAEAARLLSVLEPAQVQQRLPELGHGVQSWRSLARHRPDALLRFLRDRLAEAPASERSSLFSRFHAPLQALAVTRSGGVLALALEFASPDELPEAITRRLRLLTRRHPEEVYALLIRPGYRPRLVAQGLPRGVLAEVGAFTQEQRLALAKVLAEAPHHLAALMRAVPPSRRAALFDSARAGTPLPPVLPDALLAQLPHALRDAQAARMLFLREVREDRGRSLGVMAYRSIEHAREPLQKAATAAKAEERARALQLLVQATGLSRRGMSETLAFLARIKNEQDPVRLSALDALAGLPVSTFAAEHAPALAALADWVVEARDTSGATRQALQRLAFRLMRAQAMTPEAPLFQWALDTLRKLAHQADSLALPPLEEDLPRGAELRLVGALLPLIRAAGKRESYNLVVALAQALGRRAWGVDMLQALLKPVTEATPDGLAATAIRLWLAPPRTRDVRVRELLDRDETTITFEPVQQHLHRRRQEWLDPFLERRGLRGRFLTQKTGYVLSVSDGFHRWLPRQQGKLASLFERIAADASRGSWERMRAIHVLACIPATEVGALARLSREREVPVVEAALGALAWLDRPAPALGLLLEHLDGDRARVAAYALNRLGRRLDGETFSAALASLLGRERLKVTVQKEVVRLLGAFRSEEGLRLLVQVAVNPRLHRDARIAVGHAARRLLDKEEAWRLLEGMARSPEPDVVRSLLDQHPAGLAPAARSRYTSLLLEVARHPDLEVRREAFKALRGWVAGSEEAVARVAAERLGELQGTAEWREATQALVAAVCDGRAAEQVVATASRLVTAELPESMNASPERDLPARQRLLGLCAALLELPQPSRVHLRPLFLELARVLGQDASLWPHGVELQLSTLDWEDAQAIVAEVSRLAAEARDEPLLGWKLAAVVAAALERPATRWTPEALLAAADGLVADAPLVSVALVVAAGARVHWREDAADRLRRLRADPRLAVRSAALDVFTAAE